MVWEGWALYRAWKEAERRGDWKEAEELMKRHEEWSQTHSSEEPVPDSYQAEIENLKERVVRIERHLGIA